MDSPIPTGLKCPDCGESITEANRSDFLGHPRDFTHGPWACKRVLLAEVRCLREAVREMAAMLREMREAVSSSSYSNDVLAEVDRLTDRAREVLGEKQER